MTKNKEKQEGFLNLLVSLCVTKIILLFKNIQENDANFKGRTFMMDRHIFAVYSV